MAAKLIPGTGHAFQIRDILILLQRWRDPDADRASLRDMKTGAGRRKKIAASVEMLKREDDLSAG
jgi:hypothetical protein